MSLEDAIAQSKTWYSETIVLVENKKDSLDSKSQFRRKPDPFQGRMSRIEKTLQWSLSKLFREEGIEYLVVPVKTDLNTFGKDYEFWKAIIFYKNKDGAFDLCVLEMLSKKGKILNGQYFETASTSFLNKMQNEGNQVSGISCYLYFYDHEYKRTASFEYDNGNWQESNTALRFKKTGNPANRELAREYENCQLWDYFITWYDDSGNVIETELIYTWWECPDGPGPVDAGESDESSSGGTGENGEETIVASHTFNDLETVYVSEDEADFGQVPINYHFIASSIKSKTSNFIFDVIIYPATADPVVAYYKDKYGRNVTRTITLLDQMNSFEKLVPPTAAIVYWSFAVNAKYSYSNGDPVWTRQWNKSYSKIIN